MGQRSAFALPLTGLLCMSCLAQSTPQIRSKSRNPVPNFYAVDRVLPPYCGAHIVAVNTTQGSDAYRRLNAVGEALSTAQDGAQNLKEFSETFRTSINAVSFLSDLFESEQKAIDGLHCAAQVMAAYTQKKENAKDDLISVTLIAAFNQEAYAIQLLEKSQKERFSRQAGATAAQLVSDGEKLQAIQDVQRDAGSSILQASGLAASISADMSDTHAEKIEYTQLSCSEITQLSEVITPVAQITETIYGQSATLIQGATKSLKCRP